jgi:ABC-2 type transport system ATP-binding protein
VSIPTDSAAPAIDVRNLTKQFGERAAVDRFDLHVPRGVVAGFVGPNGAGKTTTMAMLLGLVRPSEGDGEVLGCPIGRPAEYVHRVGALIESPAFYSHLTGVENLRLLSIVGRHDPAGIPDLLELVGLDDRARDAYRTYSLGMKQRLGIAAALLGDPELLVLDEPANGLDPQGMREMRDIVRRVAGQDRTVLVSSHVLSELEQVCDWLVLIDTGRSVYQGPADEFLDRAAGIAVTARPDQLDRLADVLAEHALDPRRDDGRMIVSLDGRDPAELAAAINVSAFAAGLVLTEISPVRDTLEDRYLAMVGHRSPAPPATPVTEGVTS